MHTTLLMTSIGVILLVMPMHILGRDPPYHTMKFLSPRAIFQLCVGFVQENETYNQISTQSIGVNVILQTMHEIFAKTWLICPAHKTFVHFEQNVKSFYHLQRHPIAFSIFWYPPFADLTYGTHKRSKSHNK